MIECYSHGIDWRKALAPLHLHLHQAGKQYYWYTYQRVCTLPLLCRGVTLMVWSLCCWNTASRPRLLLILLACADSFSVHRPVIQLYSVSRRRRRNSHSCVAVINATWVAMWGNKRLFELRAQVSLDKDSCKVMWRRLWCCRNMLDANSRKTTLMVKVLSCF